MSDPDSRADAFLMLEDFCSWLGREYNGCVVGPDLLQEARRVFADEKNQPATRDRRSDFVSRLMVCGFAHLLTEPGRTAYKGYISRGFIPIFVRAFGKVAKERSEPSTQAACRSLLEKAESEGVAEAEAWKFFLGNENTRSEFMGILDDVMTSTCLSEGGMAEVYEAIVEATPYGVTGLYDREDVYLIFASWLEFMVRAGQAGLCDVEIYTKALEALDRDIRAIYATVASFYLEDVEACLRSPDAS